MTQAPLNLAEVETARQQLARAQRLLAITHINPDGDAIGSLVGFGLAVRALGKEVVLACADPVPENLKFLKGTAEVTAKPTGDFDLVVVLDVSEASRMGGAHGGRAIDLLFDHHVTNSGFARFNFIDVTAASTAELVADLLEPLGLPLTQPVAEGLLTGLVNDTIGFRTLNTTTKSLALAQRLMEAGAVLHTIYDLSMGRRSLGSVRLWTEGLTRLKVENRVAWTTLPLEARKAAGYTGKGDADLVNFISTIREADIAIVFTETPSKTVKVSWRSAPYVNVATLATAFGGGGHAPAAGAEISGTLAAVEEKVLAATHAALNSSQSAGALISPHEDNRE